MSIETQCVLCELRIEFLNITKTKIMLQLFKLFPHTRVGTLIVATIYLQLIQNMIRSFTVLQCSHHHCVQPVASDVEVVGYL